MTSRRILIVDDNRDLAENLGELLELEGFEPTVLTSSRAALARAQELVFDVALLDVRMPDVDGIELCAALAALHPHATFLLMTAFTAEGRIAEAERAGATAVLSKPVPLERLLTLLEQGARTVLLVEDDEELRASLRRTLEERGYHVIAVTTLADAEDRVRTSVPPLAVVELLLPDGSGEQLAQRLVERGARVVMIGAAEQASVDRLLSALAPHIVFVGRPFTAAQVVELLARIKKQD